MKFPKPNPQTARGGFTLIELLIVIAIILVLVGLLSAAVTRAVIRGQEAKNRSELMQLEMAVQAFKTQYNFYPPSRMLLCDRDTDYAAYAQRGGAWALLANDSMYYLHTMFPRLLWSTPQPAAPNLALWQGMDWNADGRASSSPLSPANDYEKLLLGDQCLVWFLGGSPFPTFDGTPFDLLHSRYPVSLIGYATNPSNPAPATYPVPPTGAPAATTRTPLFYEFQPNRLVDVHSPSGGNPRSGQRWAFPSYLDAYGRAPYLYLSSYRENNGYERYGPGDGVGNNVLGAIRPYRDTSGRYYKANSFQIISAGRNGIFCAGLVVPNPSGGFTVVPPTYIPGDAVSNNRGVRDWLAPPLGGGNVPSDDQANFASGLISGGQ